MKKISLILALIFTFLFISVACSDQKNKESKIYTSFYPIYFLASEIAGDKIEVVNLASGMGGHDFEPNSMQYEKIRSQSKLFIYSGAGMEAWAEKFIKTLNDNKPVVLEASKGIKLIDSNFDNDHEDEHEEDNDHEHEEDHDHGIYDPHVWTSPKSALIMLKNIYEAITLIDAENQEYYTQNYNNIKAKLEELDNLYTQGLALHSDKTIIVSHNAFGYLCRDYDIKQLSVKGVFDDENNLNIQAQIISFIRENSYIKALYWDNSSTSKAAFDSIIQQLITENRNLYISELSALEYITEKNINDGKNYLDIMRQNLDNILAGF